MLSGVQGSEGSCSNLTYVGYLSDNKLCCEPAGSNDERLLKIIVHEILKIWTMPLSNKHETAAVSARFKKKK